jgi:hypothetical protein
MSASLSPSFGEDKPLLSIGILAHNEKLNIRRTLESLFSQTVFEEFPTELVVVANGCTDETTMLATRALDEHHLIWSKRGSARVETIATAGKTNAWNEFVNRLSSRSASILLLMDADIVFLNAKTISSMVNSLMSSSDAVVCVDRPTKDIELDRKRGIFQSLLLSATPKFDLESIPLCGQLYCALASELRQIQLPLDLPIEDGFLRGLLVTQGFTKPENAHRIILAPDAAHLFGAVATPLELYRHEKWVVSGSIIAMLLFERFSRECSENQSAMALMREWHQKDPYWLPHFVSEQVRERGWRLLPRQWWFRRWTGFDKLPIHRKLRRIPVAIIASLADISIFIPAIMDVRKGRAFRYWRSQGLMPS